MLRPAEWGLGDAATQSVAYVICSTVRVNWTT
jgi:hypothetical protein